MLSGFLQAIARLAKSRMERTSGGHLAQLPLPVTGSALNSDKVVLEFVKLSLKCMNPSNVVQLILNQLLGVFG